MYRPKHKKPWYSADEAQIKNMLETTGLIIAGVVFWGALLLAWLR